MCHSMSRGILDRSSRAAEVQAGTPAKQPVCAACVASEVRGCVQRFGMGTTGTVGEREQRADAGGPIHVRLARR
jgi:hypothetical protein